MNSLTAFLQSSKKTILLILAVALITLIASTLISMWLSSFHNLNFPSIGTIYTSRVEAYWDILLKNKTEEIRWGAVYPGTSNNVTFYLQSMSNIETILNLDIANWAFKNSDNQIVTGPTNTTTYMNLTWNYNEAPIEPNQTIQVTLTLKISSAPEFTDSIIERDIKTFSFDIIITATAQEENSLSR